MKGAIIYFSGTGNTEFAAKQFKNEFQWQDIECSMIDVSKKKKINDIYDFLIFGAPIHAEVFPDFFMNWIDKNIIDGRNRRCIVFSTQAAESGAGADVLSKLLIKRGFRVAVQDFIKMPNNYYVVGFGRDSDEKRKILKERAEEKIKLLVKNFILNKDSIRRVPRIRQGSGKAIYKAFYSLTRKWARKKLKVDMKVCVKCSKCVKNCPTQNISLNEKITFKDNCISCQKCLHCCPVNAFRYKDNGFEQYKI